MKDNEIYEIKDMYDVKLFLSRYIDILEFVKSSLDSEGFRKEQLNTVLELLIEFIVLNMNSIED